MQRRTAPFHRTPRAAVAAVAMLTVVGLSGCHSGGADKHTVPTPSLLTRLTAQIANDPSLHGITGPQAACYAKIVVKYVPISDITAYLRGDTATVKFPNSTDAAVRVAAKQCLAS
ncbi:MAG: hypothetical protein DLM56_07665 [Pseudonocardiales bacterium]|nr:MAG: hypothetical protein DLM56_07665 [Pseudonocardiales bacterium]